ncbi:MAG: hypothetical protein K0B15_13160 [Lentimicrobium sp.]|nr:hypothetical protein [Lentimicrobium sp.]
MKKFCSTFLIFLLLTPVYAQKSDQLTIRGELLTDQRILMKADHDWAWNETRLDLKLDKRSGKVKFFGNVWLKHLGGPATLQSSGLYSKDQISPWNLDLREAYAEVSGFVFENLDLKVGRQRIAWGTADRFNPTSNLNPFDLEDVFDFGRQQGSEALNLTWHFNDRFSLQGVYLPFFRPSNLPLGLFSGVLAQPFSLPGDLRLSGHTDKLLMPRHNFAEGATTGIRFKGFALNYDFSVSYIYGRDGISLMQSARIVPLLTFPYVNVEAALTFPRNHIFGGDVAGSIGSVGVWAEAALFVPQKEIIQSIDLSLLYPESPVPVISDSITLEKKTWLKLAVGADYTFHKGTYLNVQYLHGFLHERGQGNLNDYLILAIEKSFWNDQFLLRPIAGGMVVSDWSKPSENFAVFYTPEFIYKGIDNFQIGMGVFVFEGKGQSLFTGFKDFNMLQFKAKLSF